MRYKIGAFVVLLLCCWGLARFTHKQTKGFRLTKITNNCSPIYYGHEPFPQSEELKGPFTYFGRGIQSFCFLSEDKTVVLKLFNNRYQNRLFWLNKLPSIGPWKEWREKKISQNLDKWIQTFQSYHIAESELRDEAKLIYTHFNPSSSCPDVTIIDPLGIKHKISLSNCAFVLQKRGQLVYDYIEEKLNNSQRAEAERAIVSLIDLMQKKMDHGIDDRDPLVRANFGFCGDEPMQIDIGPFRLDPELKNPERQREKLEAMTLGFKHWIENRHPELLPTFNDALNSH